MPRSAAPIRPASRSGGKRHCAIAPLMPAAIKFFGRYKGGAIRDGVIMAIGDINAAPVMGTWSCDSDEAVAAFDLRS
jgi:hypothetical protein